MPRLNERIIPRLTRRVEQNLRAMGVRERDRLLVGVSGGPDSVGLLHLLFSLRERFPMQLHIAHLDHGLRGEESGADARFVADRARAWNLPLSTDRVDVSEVAKRKKVSIQIAARETRYAFFQRISEKTHSRWVALGHTADDQAETFLLRLFRGAGPHGLGAIPPSRPILTASAGEVRIIRPVLNVRRDELLGYLNAQSIPYREDASNLKPVYQRNRLRQEVIPLLISRYNPRLIETLCHTADLLREEQELLRTWSSEALSDFFSRAVGADGAFDAHRFRRMPRGVQRLALREAVRQAKGDLAGMTYRHIEDSVRYLNSGKSGGILELPGGVRICLGTERFWILRKGQLPARLTEIVLKVPGETWVPELGFAVRVSRSRREPGNDPRHCASLSGTKVHPPLILRSRQDGDYFFPAGMGGKRKKLQDFLVDEKVPRHERNRVPVLTSPEGILWIVGYRMDGRFLAGPESRESLRVEILREGG